MAFQRFIIGHLSRIAPFLEVTSCSLAGGPVNERYWFLGCERPLHISSSVEGAMVPADRLLSVKTKSIKVFCSNNLYLQSTAKPS